MSLAEAKIGKNGGDSRTGHNFCLGAETQGIIAAQPFSQNCRICELAEKTGNPIRDHRCPRNFPTDLSSKAMEPMGAVQHCIDIANSVHNVYVHTFIGDDDSTTRANLKHSYAAIIARDHPEIIVNGKVPSKLKRQYGWPVKDVPLNPVTGRTTARELSSCHPRYL